MRTVIFPQCELGARKTLYRVVNEVAEIKPLDDLDGGQTVICRQYEL